jgi:hypothetical protein
MPPPVMSNGARDAGLDRDRDRDTAAVCTVVGSTHAPSGPPNNTPNTQHHHYTTRHDIIT